MLFYKEKILTPGQLKRLSEHKYSCESVSISDKLLQPWWNWLVSKVPLWLAPNLITISGLIVNIITTLILIWFSPDATSEAPRWAFILCALGLFIYQSLDAIDGKQARRTGSSSPLGELFDHGCDSISTVFVAVSACIAVKLGTYPSWMFFQCFCAFTLFYCAHWQTYVSGTLRFGKIDVTEAQFSIMAIHIISALLGPDIWETKIFTSFDFMDLLHCMILATNGCALYSLYNISFIIFTGGIGKNGSTVAGTSVISPIIPLSLVVIPAYIIYRKSPQNVFENHPVLYIMSFGLVAAKVTNRLVVAHMTRNEMEYLDSALIGPAMLFLNQYFSVFIPEYIVLWICLMWVCFDLIRYSRQVCLEICDHMRIHLFRISANPSGQQHPNKNGTASISSYRQTRSRKHYKEIK